MASDALAPLTSHSVAKSLVTQLRGVLPPNIAMALDGDARIIIESAAGLRVVFDIASIIDQDAGDRGTNILTSIRSFLDALQDLIIRERSSEWPDGVLGSAQAWTDAGRIHGGFGRNVADATTLITISAS